MFLHKATEIYNGLQHILWRLLHLIIYINYHYCILFETINSYTWSTLIMMHSSQIGINSVMGNITTTTLKSFISILFSMFKLLYE